MITRDTARAAKESFDVIVVGGGIYGACMALELAQRGQRALVLERDDFGGATTWNSMRIVHGGLRYLQSLDLIRFRESVTERHWFLQNFPELVRPLRCLMPLYGRGLKRPGIMRIALGLNHLLSADRNRDVQPECHLAAGGIVGVADTLRLFPNVPQKGLAGAGEWYDAVMVSPQRIMMEILRWASANGAWAINYVSADGVLLEDGRVSGVTATDRLSGERLQFPTKCVLNCAGPWSRQFTAVADRERPQLFEASLAINLLLDVKPSSELALAVAPERGEPVYFLYPYRGMVLAGTVHAPWNGPAGQIKVEDSLISRFVDDLNSAVPGMGATPKNVKRVFAGYLPTTHAGGNKLTKRPVVVDHGAEGGPGGLVSLAGIKLTTARKVAEQVLKLVEKRGYLRLQAPRPLGARPRPHPIDLVEPSAMLKGDLAQQRSVLEKVMAEEAVVTREDLILRRTGWGDDPDVAAKVEQKLAGLFDKEPSPRLRNNGKKQAAMA